MRRLFFLLLFLGPQAWAVSTIAYIVHDADSQAFQLCVPELAGEEWFAVDFNTTSLNITIAAIGGTYTTFDYSGGNIDDGPTTFAWGNPTTSAVEIDAISTGALTGCFILSVRDEVFAVANASQWSIVVSDGGSALMDQEFIIFASVADSIESKVDTAQTDLDTLTGSDGATLATTQSNYAPATVAALSTAQSVLDTLADGGVLVSTTIATLSTQVSFTLTAGSADDNAYNRKIAVIIDASTATQIAVGKVLDYIGSSKTVTLAFDPGVFTMAAADNIVILSSEF